MKPFHVLIRLIAIFVFPGIICVLFPANGIRVNSLPPDSIAMKRKVFKFEIPMTTYKYFSCITNKNLQK